MERPLEKGVMLWTLEEPRSVTRGHGMVSKCYKRLSI